MDLPTIINLNPRSVYNKIDEFHALVEEEDVDIVFMSESWERENKTLHEIIHLEDHIIISNVNQRKEVGGRPALIVKSKNYLVQDLTNSVIQIPWGVEVVWALITPKNVQNDSKIQRIILGSIYSKPNSKKKKATLDHITDVYNHMNTKYKKGLHWILAGDTNDMKLDVILQLSPEMKQLVTEVTRLNPPRILDPIITTLGKYYQKPLVLPPLDNDPNKNGSPSDHKIIKMKPISNINNKPARTKREVTFRPLPESGLNKLKEWFDSESWENVTNANSAHDKAAILETTCIAALDRFLPTKTVTFTSDDSPWITPQIKTAIRQRKREFSKHRRSQKWQSLNEKVLLKIGKAKRKYYSNMVEDLKSSNKKQWYSKLKRISSYDQHLTDPVQVSEICEYSDQEQAEMIANCFSKISQEYDALISSDIVLPPFTEASIPHITQKEVLRILETIKTKVSTSPGDIPATIVKKFAGQLSKPVTDILNTSIKTGQWPNIYKVEAVTPIPKVFPPKSIEDLRNISGLKTLDKVSGKKYF